MLDYVLIFKEIMKFVFLLMSFLESLVFFVVRIVNKVWVFFIIVLIWGGSIVRFVVKYWLCVLIFLVVVLVMIIDGLEWIFSVLFLVYYSFCCR